MTKAGGGSECEILISSTLRRAEHNPAPLPFPCQVNELSHEAGGGNTWRPLKLCASSKHGREIPLQKKKENVFLGLFII